MRASSNTILAFLQFLLIILTSPLGCNPDDTGKPAPTPSSAPVSSSTPAPSSAPVISSHAPLQAFSHSTPQSTTFWQSNFTVPADGSLTPWQRPYRVLIYHAWHNFRKPHAQARQFAQQLEVLLNSRYPHCALLTLQLDQQGRVARTLLSVTTWRNVPAPWRQQWCHYDVVWILHFKAQLQSTSLRLRQLIPEVEQLGPVINRSLPWGTDKSRYLLEIWPELFALQAYVIRPPQKQGYPLHLRLAPRLWKRWKLSPGTIFAVQCREPNGHYRVVQNSYCRLQQCDYHQGVIQARGTFLGWYRPRPGDRLSRIYFAGGCQELIVTGPRQQAKEGFQVFADYQGYSTASEAYRGLTDAQGRFLLQDPQHNLLYVTIASHVQGLRYLFARRMIVVQPGQPPVRITIEDLSPAALQKAQHLHQRWLSKQTKATIRRRVCGLIERARLATQQANYTEALQALQIAQVLLRQIGDQQAQQLTQAMQAMQQVCQQRQQRQQEARQRRKALRLLSQINKQVLQGQYELAHHNLKKALQLWPAAATKLKARLKRVEQLLAEQNQPLGQARSFIIHSRPLHLTAQSDQLLTELKQHVSQLIQHGQLDLNQPYSDGLLLHQLKLDLDRFAQVLVKLAQRSKQEYDHSDNLKKRKALFQANQRIIALKEMVDELIMQIP